MRPSITLFIITYMLFDMGSQRWILMKLSQEVQMDSPFPLTPSPGPSGTSMSSKTPGSDLEDRWSLDTVSDYGSWWNFPRMFRWIVPSFNTISWFIRNLHVLQDSRKWLGGQVESWQGSWRSILMKISQEFPKTAPSYLTQSPGSSGTSMSSKTPGRDFRDSESLDRAPDVGFWWNFHSN